MSKEEDKLLNDYDDEDDKSKGNELISYSHGRSTPTPMGKSDRILHRIKDWLYPSGDEMSTEQVTFYAALLGIVGALMSVVYQQSLKWIIKVIWNILPTALNNHTAAFKYIPIWNYNWIVPTVLGFIVGILLKYLPPPGNVPNLIENLHNKGGVGYFLPSANVHSGEFIIPMFIISMVSISAGGSCGPEASLLIMMGSLSGKVGTFLRQGKRNRRILSIAGMSGGLSGKTFLLISNSSAFFGIPLGGALFVLEMPHRTEIQYYEAITPAVVASLVAAIVSTSILNQELGGEFDFPPLKEIKTLQLIEAIGIGILGAAIAFIFIFLAHQLKHFIHSRGLLKKYPIILATLGGFLLGWAAVLYPQTLFWSEAELQHMLDRGASPLPHTAVPGALLLSIPFPWYHCLGIGLMKMATILITICAGWPGGIIFPLMYVGGWIAQAIGVGLPQLQPTVLIMCMMASVEVSVLRTPWSINIILILLHRSFSQNTEGGVAVFPLITMSVYVALLCTRKYCYYPHSLQHGRQDVQIIQQEETIDLPTFEETPFSETEKRGLDM